MIGYSQNKAELYRALWLGITVFYYIIYPVLVLALFQYTFGANPFFIKQIQHPLMIAAAIALFGLLLLIPFWIVYHCAYKSGGNKFLTFCLIAGPFKLGLALFQLVGHPITPWIIGLFMADLFFYSAWYLASLYLWKVNAAAKRQKQVVFLHDLPVDEAALLCQR